MVKMSQQIAAAPVLTIATKMLTGSNLPEEDGYADFERAGTT